MIEILEVLFFMYLGAGIGLNIQMFKGGEKLYLSAAAGPIPLKEVKRIWFVLFIIGMTGVWPLYYFKQFRKEFLITGRWE